MSETSKFDAFPESNHSHEEVIILNYTKLFLLFRYYIRVLVSDFYFEIVINFDFSKAIKDLQWFCTGEPSFEQNTG